LWRMKIISTSPFSTSADNGSNIVVNNFPAPSVAVTAPHNLRYILPSSSSDVLSRTVGVTGQPITFKENSNSLTVNWLFGANASPSTSTSNSTTVTFSTPGLQQEMVAATNSA